MFGISNEDAQVLFSFVVALSGAIYTFLTWKLVSESKKTRQFQITPDLNIYFDYNETDSSFLYVIVRNSGFGTAQSVKFNVSASNDDFYQAEHHNLKEMGVFKNGVKNFYPSQQFKYFVTDLSQNTDQKENAFLKINVNYSNILGKEYNQEFILEVASMLGGGKFTPPDTWIGRIAYRHEQIMKLLAKHFNIDYRTL